ncbi:hypothetical protein CANMA_003822 [Candida margitis]|uniref:uncharacterized protein n=1 Tax=Candida margitis TaxID=1775924 RepID=UPI002226211C|nr:uncharacterized protein CANMA_003822 [Candida margitis]KAI5961302.1 hypothetical protein CANMA_003822 [Candida margitis]
MICAISGEEVKDPIVSPKSGAVFERKYIEKYVSTSGTDPINNQPLTINELIALQVPANSTTNIVPPVNSLTSIPGMLSTLQNEYDAMVLEIFTLRKNLQSLKQELSASLYRQDAAINVAAKAIRERDEAKEALENLVRSLEVKKDGEEVEDEDSGDKITDIQPARDELFKSHKTLKVKFPYKFDHFKLKNEHTTEKVFDVSVDLVQFHTSTKVLLGTHKNEVMQYNVVSTKLDVWKTELKTIGLVAYNNNGILAAATGRKVTFSTGTSVTIKRKISTIHCHPSLNLFVLTSSGNWYIANTNKILATYETESDFIKGEIHGDGEIFAAYDGNKLKLLSLVSGDELAAYDIGNTQHVQQIAFAPNGYWLLILSTSSDANAIQIYDLRKNIEVNKLTIAKERSVQNFTIDPSSSLIVVQTDSGYLTLSYSKKTKTWSEIEPLSLDGVVPDGKQDMFVYSTGDDVLNDGEVKYIHYNFGQDRLALEKLAEK